MVASRVLRFSPRVVVDVGCGTGEILARLAAKYPTASFTGIDLEEPHLERAAVRNAEFWLSTLINRFTQAQQLGVGEDTLKAA